MIKPVYSSKFCWNIFIKITIFLLNVDLSNLIEINFFLKCYKLYVDLTLLNNVKFWYYEGKDFGWKHNQHL